jgi:hypothetical protein
MATLRKFCSGGPACPESMPLPRKHNAAQAVYTRRRWSVTVALKSPARSRKDGPEVHTGRAGMPPVGVPTGVWGGLLFVCHALECSVIHLTASYSVIKPLITSVSPSGHRISIPQPAPGFFRAAKVGSCSDIHRICACGEPVQGSYPATIKRSHHTTEGCSTR